MHTDKGSQCRDNVDLSRDKLRIVRVGDNATDPKMTESWTIGSFAVSANRLQNNGSNR